jgi:hypothetical protein
MGPRLNISIQQFYKVFNRVQDKYCCGEKIYRLKSIGFSKINTLHMAGVMQLPGA